MLSGTTSLDLQTFQRLGHNEMEVVHYHQVIPERVCEVVKGFLGRLVGLEVNWDIKQAEAPLDTVVEPVTDWPEAVDGSHVTQV